MESRGLAKSGVGLYKQARPIVGRIPLLKWCDMDGAVAEVQQDGPRVVAEVKRREVDTNELRELIADLQERLDGDGRTFVFGLEQVEFLPSACLALLLMFHQKVKAKDGRIVLLNCQENVAFLLRLARLDALFEIAEGNPQDV